MKSIQEYIDERPVWPDGTPMAGAPMTQMQWLIWSLAAAGKFFEGYVVFMTGVALLLISREFGIGPAENGLTGAASPLGILVGAVGPAVCPIVMDANRTITVTVRRLTGRLFREVWRQSATTGW